MKKIKIVLLALFCFQLVYADENSSKSTSGQAFSGVNGDITINNFQGNQPPSTSSNNKGSNSNNKGSKEVVNMSRRYKSVEIMLKQCRKNGSKITCKFIIENKGSDTEFTFGGSSFLIDSEGEKYTAGLCTFGKKKINNRIKKLLVKNIPVKGEMEFDNVASNSKAIPLLKIGVFPGHIEFRDVPLEKNLTNKVRS